jgi:hypothetical protein
MLGVLLQFESFPPRGKPGTAATTDAGGRGFGTRAGGMFSARFSLTALILHEKTFNLKLSGHEVYYTIFE